MSDINTREGAVQTPHAIYLKDYQPPAYLVESVQLDFALDAEQTIVNSTLQLRRNSNAADGTAPLVLYGHDLMLKRVCLDVRELAENEYDCRRDSLVITDVPEHFVLQITTEICPAANTALEGLYQSSVMLCTQCEAEGFRRITYFPDRPDVMSRYSVRMVADKQQYPVLLSNGNLVESGELDNGKHFALWEDPSLKPSYLFALVAGQLEHIRDEFITVSGRTVELRLYTEAKNIHKCEHAMHSLKQAMAWDEQTYGREYELDIYMIVAVDDFNMGAMENKGLNIFNSSCVLASPETATDDDYYKIQSIIGHEYFHNWSGNRVTCRDWFQLSLKEGFTVFRDQEFSSDLNSRAVQRIDDVDVLRNFQFAEDNGPMAHPIRPDNYIEISNFYTVTVYNKGAEVVRMLRNLLGAKDFRQGTDLYFERHDGQAVTCDDFVRAMEDANAVDLTQFRRWYAQAGTPELDVTSSYDAGQKLYTLQIKQSTPPTPGQKEKLPLHIPVAVGLLNQQGRAFALNGADTTRVLAVQAAQNVFHFENIPEKPVLSVLRGFSAPVKVKIERSEDELAFLLAHDTDEFNRWDAGQSLALQELLRQIAAHQKGEPLPAPIALCDAIRTVLADASIDKALLTRILILPSESYLADQMQIVDVDAIYHARLFSRRYLAETLYEEFLRLYTTNHDSRAYVFDNKAMAQRSLKNTCLGYLVETESQEDLHRCFSQFETASNMTDREQALAILSNHETPYRQQALEAFYRQWHDDAQVIEKWLAVRARSRLPDTLQDIEYLLQHEAFSIKNPNKVRALIGGFCRGNPVRFHSVDGAGYDLLTDIVLQLDKLNPQIAARLIQNMIRWQRYDAQRQTLMKSRLQQIYDQKNLSKDVFEIVERSLTEN